MSILSIIPGQTGLVGVLPSIAYIYTTNTESEILATGFLNKEVQNGIQFSLPCAALVSTKATPTSAFQVGFYQISHVGSDWSLIPTASPGDVVLPTIANHLIVSTDVNGQLGNLTGTAINDGSLQAGRSGIAGTLISFPGTASKGSLIVAAVANTGDTITTISNVAMGQASVFSIPDPVNAVGRFLVAATATPFVSSNIPRATGTGGVMIDSGIAYTAVMQNNAVNTMSGVGQIILAKANGTEAANAVTASGNAGVITTSSLTTAGGASYAITWTNTLITSSSVILLTLMGGTNTTVNLTMSATAGAGTSTLTIYNNTAATPFDGTLLIGYTIL